MRVKDRVTSAGLRYFGHRFVGIENWRRTALGSTVAVLSSVETCSRMDSRGCGEPHGGLDNQQHQ